MKLNPLTPEEKKVIKGKNTEKPFSGEYDNFTREGLYLCRQCNSPLYESKDKFDAHCGWPSFDQEIAGAVKRQIDKDGLRTEILCATCGAHLGHVFEGEKMTEKDVRHCVNSLSMQFIPTQFEESQNHSAVFAGGCFWCLEAVFLELKGVLSVVSGYSGGYVDNPSYEQVSRGVTGHAESVEIVYDPSVINYKDLLDIFFSIHDPTTLDRQGDDIGSQYRSVVFYKTLVQKKEAEEMISKLDKSKIFSGHIVTEVRPFVRFYPAEETHQEYYERNKDKNPYCQIVINPKLAKFKEKYKHLLK
jgi:peptide methionine sulfoxide reductase msrA/msrB